MEMKDFLQKAAHVVPSARQKSFLENPFYAFVHFSPNTYTNLEWGLGNENPAIFNPVELDCDQWVKAIKSAGMTGMVLTAKHHDGFCLWPSKYTEHCIKNSPYKNGKGDIVKEAAEACRRGGIRFGFYLSPWDRHSRFYGTDAYNDYYKNQLTELLTQYGDIFYVWFDGACGEGKNGRKQEYDFQGYIDLIRKYQPNACIFNDHGPDIRWVGNESGNARFEEWMVLPKELCFRCEVQTGEGPNAGLLEGIYNTDGDLGSESVIRYSRGLTFCPAEVDMSIRKGWFYHKDEEPHSLERLFQTYLTSVGGSATFNLNIPPMPNGKFDERDVRRLKELGDKIRETFASEIIPATKITREDLSENQVKFHFSFAEETAINTIVLREQIENGQRVERFRVFADDAAVFSGTTIGSQRICAFNRPVKAKDFTVFVYAVRDTVDDLQIQLY